MTTHPPLVVHHRHEYRRPFGAVSVEALHPCDTKHEPGVTLEPRVTNWDPATQSWLPTVHVNCPDCIATLARWRGAA